MVLCIIYFPVHRSARNVRVSYHHEYMCHQSLHSCCCCYEQEINKSTAMQFVILFRDAGMQYRALYVYNPDDEVANEVVVTKIHGTGPKQLSSKSMERFYKYIAFCSSFS